ncbi:MAG: 7-cyano-7-deazaguanine synthase QueC [Acidipila sp.]|nr:7-cyano-7-deazaguanine synthase QueC [Acidipila sp.]
MTANSKAVVLLSGGMDSCVTAAIAAQTHSLALVHASYGQRTAARERRAFDEIANFYGVSDRDRLVARLDYFAQIGGSALTDSSIAVPQRAAGAARGTVRGTAANGGGEIPVTYVPFRNAHFLSVAVSWAEAIGAGSVWIGAVAEDSSGYPDCRPDYYRAFQELVRVGTRPETRIEIITPVIHLRKSAIICRGIDIGAPLHLTWSCYQNDDQACGSCDSCLLRLSAYTEAGVADPIRYRNGVAPY